MHDTSPGLSSPQNNPTSTSRLRFRTDGNWWSLVWLVGILTATLIASMLISLAVRDAVRSGDIGRPGFLSGQVSSSSNNPVAFHTPIPGITLEPAATVDLDTIPGYSGTRVTVLLMGIDRRPGESNRTRTDSMMLLSLDPTTKQAAVLSLPRDLYVDIPGYGLDRVNSANVYGGGELAKQTVEYNLGVRVDRYVLIDFNAFVTVVDTVGGIDVNVPRTINDPEYPDHNYGFDPFYIEAGLQHLDGETALKYARTRHADNDFNRAQRQQEVLMALRAKVVSFDMLPTLLGQAPSLINTLGDSIETDMPVNQMLSLAVTARDVPGENIQSAVIDGNYITVYTTQQGASVLIPQRDKIGTLIQQLFYN